MSVRFSRPRSLAAGALAVAVPAAVALAVAVPGGAALASGPGNEFHQTNLISDLSNQGAQVVDKNLQNSVGPCVHPGQPAVGGGQQLRCRPPCTASTPAAPRRRR